MANDNKPLNEHFTHCQGGATLYKCNKCGAKFYVPDGDLVYETVFRKMFKHPSCAKCGSKDTSYHLF